MSSSPMLVIGAGGHAHALLDILQRHGGFMPVGLIDSFQPAGRKIYGLPILGGVEDVPQLCEQLKVQNILVAIGDNYQRKCITERLQQHLANVIFPTLVDPTAVVSTEVQISAGVVIMAQVHVGPGTVLEEGALLNTKASLDHDSILRSFASLAPGVVTGGNVHIGAGSAIGLGSCLRHRIEVGSDSVVGAGSLVLTDLPSGVVAYGVPARVVRSRQHDEPYL